MRIDVKKFLFMGVHTHRETFFKNAQEAGIIHFINNDDSKFEPNPPEIEQITRAIKVLRSLPPLEQEESQDDIWGVTLAQQILEIKHNIDKLKEEHRILSLELARVRPFGDFSKEDLEFIEKNGDRKIHFYYAKKGMLEEFDRFEDLIFLNEDEVLDYFISISKDPIINPKLIPVEINEPSSTLKKQFKTVEHDLHNLERHLMSYAKYNSLLHWTLIKRLNHQSLNVAQDNIQYALDERLFAALGWVPQNKMDELQALISKLDVQCEEVAIEETDFVPTYLHNEGIARVGEDLVHIYDTPSSRDKDPSLWVLFSFALFFAFIVNDAGYGLLYLALALFLKFKFPNLKGLSRRLLNLLTILGISCTVWGIVSTTSFFGIELDLDNPLHKVSIVSWLTKKKAEYIIANQDSVYQEWVTKYPQLKGIENPHALLKAAIKEKDGKTIYEMHNKFVDNVMFELALLFGVIHLTLSFARNLKHHWSGIGWILFLIGGYLYIPARLQVTTIPNYVFGLSPEVASSVGLQLIFGGIALASILAFIKDKFLGLLEPIHLIQIFADVLSYIRLYALGLAGLMLAITINDLALGLPWVFAVIMVIISHAINMVLGIMSGVIHGLRLNFLEWARYSFEGGGKQFKPLELLQKDE